VNALDQKIFLILMSAVRENLHALQIGQKIYNRCVLIERKKLFNMLNYPLDRGSYYETVRASQKRLSHYMAVLTNMFDIIFPHS